MATDFDAMIRVLLKESPSPPRTGWLPQPEAPDPNVRGPIPNGQEVVKCLRRQFQTKELAAAGILESLEKSPTKHQINSQLTGDSLWVALQDKAGRYFDVLGRQGCLLQRGPAILQTMADHHVVDGLKAGNLLFVTMDVPDMAALWSLGLAATTAHYLDRIGGAALQQFTSHLGDRSDDMRAKSPLKNPLIDKLVFTAWSPARCDAAEPAGMEAVTAHLQRLHLHLQRRFHRVFVWRPAPSDLESFAFVNRFGGREELRASMLRAIEPNLQPIVESKPVPKPTLADAILGFRRTRDEGARQQLRASLFETVERRVLERAQHLHDGLEAGRQLVAAQTISEIVEYLEERKARRLIGDRSALELSEREQERKELQTLTGILLKLIPKPAYDDGLPDLSTAELARVFAANTPKS